VIEAAAGDPVEPGVRLGFTGWVDGVTTRERGLVAPLGDTVLTAVYDDREVQLTVTLEGAEGGVVPATLEASPASEDLWFQDGREIALEIRPRVGFRFLGWTGALSGRSNPAVLTMDEPVFAGALLESVYDVPDATLALSAARPYQAGLEAVNATDPVRWSVVEGRLPDGLTLRAGGTVTGEALESGRFEVTVRARDAIGLVADGVLHLDVRDPEIALERAAGPFLQAGTSLSEAEEVFLDRRGNRDGRYDLGDFRAWAFRGAGEAVRSTAAEHSPMPERGTEQVPAADGAASAESPDAGSTSGRATGGGTSGPGGGES